MTNKTIDSRVGCTMKRNMIRSLIKEIYEKLHYKQQDGE